MRLEIITPDQVIFDGEVSRVQFPGNSGAFEVLSNHAPMIAAVKGGAIKVVNTNGETQEFQTSSGFVEVRDNQVTALV
jgi:ATP synthase, F1 epsilon subunit (delta in mitochondria)